MSFPISFLAPLAGLIAAAAIPPLVLLYFLKLRRQQRPVSSTLLWKRAVEDLQVNAPFQKLRNNLLLLLQLLLLILAITALTEPIWNRAPAREDRMVLLLDHSASMNVVESGGRTRLDDAKTAAEEIVDNLEAGDEIMIIAFADRARLIANFTTDKAHLKSRIDAIEPTDETSRLADALTLADAYATPIGEGIGVTANPIAPPHQIIISDGRIADAADLALRRGSAEFIPIGKSTQNLGIVQMNARREYERRDHVSIIAVVRNFGREPASRDVALYVDGDLKQVRQIPELPPAPADDSTSNRPVSTLETPPNEIIITFDELLTTAGRVEVRLVGDDALDSDNHAFALVAPPQPLKLLLVTYGNHFLRTAMSALAASLGSESKGLDVLTPEQYEQAPEEDLIADGRSTYDLVVFDDYSTQRLPLGNYLFFGGVPRIDDIAIVGDVQGDLFIDWDETHAVLRHVPISVIRVVQSRKLELPSEAAVLIEGAQTPELVYLSRDRRQYLICAFSLFDDERTHLNTNWPLQEGFPVFMYNAAQFLAGNAASDRWRTLHPGEAIELTARPGEKELTVRRPDGKTEQAPVRDNSTAYYGNTDRVGIYTAPDAVEGDATFAVNLFNTDESNVAPNADLSLGADNLAVTSATRTVNRPLWPYFVLAALGVLFLEWFIYAKRVYI